ncbi:DUF3659 domain-containing protein [Aspergillus undulatus]|uniref:DUF3659 domain-containing protein n=1 Tax=Aspergillus undulatus TaxID=1810928 RepID=UPI003CCD9299
MAASLTSRASDTAMDLKVSKPQHRAFHEQRTSTPSSDTASVRRGADETASRRLSRFAKNVDNKGWTSAGQILNTVKLPHDGGQGARSKGGYPKGFDLDLSERLPVALPSLTGLVIGKEGRILNREGHTIGKVVEGDPEDLVGEIVSENGEILNEDGDLIGSVDVIRPNKVDCGKNEESGDTAPDKAGTDNAPDISTLEGFTCNKAGDIVTPDGVHVGEVFEGDPKKISSEGFQLDDQGYFWDYRGVTVGKARPTPLREDDKGPFADQDLLVAEHSWVQSERKPGKDDAGIVKGFTGVSALEGMKVDKHGNVVDDNGVVFGHAVSESMPTKPGDDWIKYGAEEPREKRARSDLVGIIVNDEGYMVDKREHAEETCVIVRQIRGTIGPLCRRIVLRIKEAKQAPKDQIDEKQLVQEVNPLIEEAGNVLQDCKGALSALGPDNNMAATIMAGTPQTALPAEYELAELLKELAQMVIDTITNGRQLLSEMPHARKSINLQWSLLSEPLFQIIGTVGLLLNGISGLFTRLIDRLWLGKTLRALLAGRGIDQQLLRRLGLERILRGLVSREIWIKKILDSLGLWGLMRGLLVMFGLDKLLESFRLGAVSEALELLQQGEVTT